MSETENTIEVPVLELEFNKLCEVLSKINLVDAVTLISMPNHVKSYADRDANPIDKLVMEIIDYQKEENSWRLKELKIQDITVESDNIKVAGKTIFDSNRVIIISKLNSVFIVPGEKSLAEGNCLPNEIIKLSNLISSQLFLLQFNDVKEENSESFNLKVEYRLINRTGVSNTHED